MKVEIGPYEENRKIDIHIDEYDTWGMDHTLALIILPMLKQLRGTMHGAPHVEDGDVPEELKSTTAEPKENEWDTDSNHFARWNWVLDEMIWAFEQILDEDNSSQFFSGKIEFDFVEKESGLTELVKSKNDTSTYDREGHLAHERRIANGTRLFGVYYQGLWD
jgi:hypothetical protein